MPTVLLALSASSGAPLVPLAAAADGGLSGTDPLSVLLNGGVLGIVLVLFILRKLVTGGELERVIQERDKAYADVAALRTSMEERALPLLFKATEVLERMDARGGTSP